MEQRTDEWFAARVGKVTASRIGDLMATTKSGESASRANYRGELVAERLTGKPYPHFSNAAMAWGVEQEPYARGAYEAKAGSMVEEVGFIDHQSIENAGASPDGLVGEDGLVEFKCPNTATHIKLLDGGRIQKGYLLQVQWQMACTGRDWCDFVSFDPRMPDELQLVVRRVKRDDDKIVEIEDAVRQMLTEVEETVERLRSAK